MQIPKAIAIRTAPEIRRARLLWVTSRAPRIIRIPPVIPRVTLLPTAQIPQIPQSSQSPPPRRLKAFFGPSSGALGDGIHSMTSKWQ